MFTIILYVTLCLPNVDHCEASEPVSWYANEETLHTTVEDCLIEADKLARVSDSQVSVSASCHVLKD